jgi:hypothetical protein
MTGLVEAGDDVGSDEAGPAGDQEQEARCSSDKAEMRVSALRDALLPQTGQRRNAGAR